MRLRATRLGAIGGALGEIGGAGLIPWTPAAITTALWLDAADESTITTVSGAVSEWRDKSGNGRHAAQVTADQRPTYSALSFNNLNSVLFGSGILNDFLRTTNAGLPTGNGARSIFAVYKPNRAIGVNTIAGQALNATNNTWFILHARDAGDPYLAGYSNDVNSAIAPNTNPKSAGVTHNGSTCVLYLNGTSVGTKNTTFNTNTGELSVGGNGIDEYLFGLIGEVIYCSSAVDTTIRQQIEGYLAHKWGLTANLPSDHPYKSVAPYINLNFDPDAWAYISAVEAADAQTLEDGTKSAINSFVVGCKQDGIWDAIKASCIMAGARTLAGALVPLKGTAPTNSGFVAGDYDRKTGLAGNGTKNLITNRADNLDPLLNNHLSVYQHTLHTTGNGRTIIGSDTKAIYGNNSGATYGYTQSVVSINFTTTIGFLGISRTSSSSVSVRSSQVNTNYSVPVNTASSNSISVFARYTPTASGFSNPRLSFYSIGEAIDLALLDARVTTLMNALAAAIP